MGRELRCPRLTSCLHYAFQEHNYSENPAARRGMLHRQARRQRDRPARAHVPRLHQPYGTWRSCKHKVATPKAVAGGDLINRLNRRESASLCVFDFPGAGATHPNEASTTSSMSFHPARAEVEEAAPARIAICLAHLAIVKVEQTSSEAAELEVVGSRGLVTLPCREREVSAPQELSSRCDCGPPPGHRNGAKRAVRSGGDEMALNV
jgi:hypothetical protein